MTKCPVCNAPLSVGLRSWHRICEICAYEGSILNVRICEQPLDGDLDEKAREDALKTLRCYNFRRVLKTIRQLRSKHPTSGVALRLLDVGCAHGWFLEEARTEYNTLGIEPDRNVAEATLARGNQVREGFFPDVLYPDERYDVIAFNDVLEHIPDINATLQACKLHLAPGALLVVNAPSRSGALYRISKKLLKLGRSGTFDRMWQKDFPSPHVHYLDTDSMIALADRNGFVLIQSEKLPSVSAAGLYSRIRYSQDVPALKAMFLSFAVTLAIPVLSLLPADIKVWYLKRDSTG